MKKITIFLSALVLLISSGCSGQSDDLSVNETASEETTKTVSVTISQVSEEESVEESHLPDGISEDKKGFLKFISYSGKISAVFPDKFNTLCSGYTPTDGIYLQTSDGKATLQLEYVENKGITKNSLVDYLKETYPDASIYINDEKNVICKVKMKDSQDNVVYSYLKAIVDDNGYKSAILFFKEAEMKNYETVFSKIKI